jgi:hypothetical protein
MSRFLEFRLCANSIGEKIIGVRVYGTISDENRAINASQVGLQCARKGIGNIALVLEISSKYSVSILLGGNYLNTPETNRFTVKGSLGFISRSYSSYSFQFFLFLKRKVSSTTIWVKYNQL